MALAKKKGMEAQISYTPPLYEGAILNYCSLSSLMKPLESRGDGDCVHSSEQFKKAGHFTFIYALQFGRYQLFWLSTKCTEIVKHWSVSDLNMLLSLPNGKSSRPCNPYETTIVYNSRIQSVQLLLFLSLSVNSPILAIWILEQTAV